MFDSLAEKLQATLADVRGRGTLTEDDVSKAMREIRLALLEADVNFRVVKEFTARVKERALGADVIGQLNPGQQVVKIVHEELAGLMGGAGAQLAFAACDVYRPAAVDQLVKVGGQVGVDVYEQGTERDPVDIAAWALDRAKQE